MMAKNAPALRILIVEDNEGDFALVETYLDQQPRPVIKQAESFSEASSILLSAEDDFDVILLDLTLPDNNGKTLIADIIALCNDIPVIVLTGYTDVQFSIESLSLGIADYLVKDEINAQSLYKSIVYSIERKKNISELQESEKKYSELFHLSPQPMWVYDVDTLNFLDVNAAAIEHYGYSRQEFLNMTIRNIVAGEYMAVIEEEPGIMKKNEQRIAKALFRHKTKNGEIIEVDVHSNYIIFKGQKAKIILANDITERLNYISAIETQNKKLQEIAWTQSHVVRAPLAKIMGLIDIIQTQALTDVEKGDYFMHILQAAEELDGVVKEIVKKTELVQLNTA